MNHPIEIFCCAVEEDLSFLLQLKRHINQSTQGRNVNLWDKSLIRAGDDREAEIQKHLGRADVFLLLISIGFLDSSYWKQTVMPAALRRYEAKKARIIPVIVRPAADWNKGGLENIQALPRDLIPINNHAPERQEELLRNVAQEITSIIQGAIFIDKMDLPDSEMPTEPSKRVLSQAGSLPSDLFPLPSSSTKQPDHLPPLPHRRKRSCWLLWTVGALLLVIAVIEAILGINIHQYQSHVQASATAQAQQIDTHATATAAVATNAAEGQPPTGFSVSSLTGGQQIQNGTILTIRGSYTEMGSDQVWVVLSDNFGNYYLQDHPVDFLPNNQWMVENIHPAKGIINILFVSVTPIGAIIFQGMVQLHSFQAFTQLPNGSQIQQTIPITVV